MNPRLYRIWKDQQESGPFTMSQLRSMWASGALTAENYFWTEGQTEWQPITALLTELEPIPSEPAPSQQQASLQIVELQSQMKSPGVAALLALFIPFFGAGYGSAAAMVVCLLGAIGTSIAVAAAAGLGDDPMPLTLIGISLFYLISIFWAVGGASSYNESLVTAAKEPHTKS